MAQQTINVGAAANDGTGDALRVAFQKTNANDTELYSAVAAKADATSTTSALALKAPLASPALSGTPTAPTAAAATNTTQIATTAMVQAALAAYIAAQDVLVFKGAVDCSANPNYPAADAGHVYRVSVAGKIGGASGPKVESGDVLTCVTDSSAAGSHASVGANWIITQANIDGAVIGPASATDARIAVFDGTTGKLIKDGGSTIAELVSGAADIATTIHGATSKATPVDADELGIVDSADSNALKRLTFAALKASLVGGAWTAYTPTVTPQNNSFTLLGTVTGRYIQIGKIVIFLVRIPITTNGTASGSVQFTLPVTAFTAGAQLNGAENALTGKLLNAFINTTTIARALFFDGTYPGANGAVITASGIYEAA